MIHYVCKYCYRTRTITSAAGYVPTFVNRVCDTHVMVLTKQNERYADVHRWELWNELMGVDAMTVEVGDWVKYNKLLGSTEVGEVFGKWPHCKKVYNVGGFEVHEDDILEVRKKGTP